MADNSNYSKTVLLIIRKLAVKHRIPERDALYLLDHFFMQLKQYITDPRMPRILIPSFGAFRPSLKRLKSHLRLLGINYRKGKVSKESFKKGIRKGWPVKQRMIKELNREGDSTDWYNDNLIKDLSQFTD